MRIRTHEKKSVLSLLVFFKTSMLTCFFAVLGCLSFSGVLLANTGGTEQINVLSNGDKAYIGVYKPSEDTANGYVSIDSDVNGMVIGGFSKSGTAVGHNVNMIGGIVDDAIYGGYSKEQDAINNTIIIQGGKIKDVVSGGRSENGNVRGNRVEVSGDADISGNDIFGGYTNQGIASGNTLMIYNATIEGNANGGDSDWSDALNNSIIIYGGELQKGVYGGKSVNGSASGNSVTIYGGTMRGDVHGGYGQTTNKNTVTIYGGDFKKDIYGGYVDGGSPVEGINNVINIYGNPVFEATVSIYGAKTTNIGEDVYTGNTLNIYTKGIQVKKLQSFQHYSFVLFNAAEPALLLTDPQTFQSTDTFTISYVLPGIEHALGKPITLVKSLGGINLNGLVLKGGTLKQGFTLEHTYALAQDGNSLVATITNTHTVPESKALVAARNGGFAVLNMAADLVAGAGIENAMAAGFRGGSSLTFVPFYAMGGFNQRYSIGKHIDVKSYALLFGFAKKWELAGADIVAGAFLEGSTGSYTSKDTFQTHPTVYGKGDTDNVGGGILGRLAFQNGLYAEGSLRAGTLNTSYSTRDIQDIAGNSPSYSLQVPYYGAHAGIGWLWEITPQGTSVDVYAKYLWNRQNAASTFLQLDPVKFSALNSQRVRLGFRFAYAINENIRPYLGAAWEYELAWKQRATAYGFPVSATSLKGGSGMAELGLSVRPSASMPVTLDFGVQGYLGKRQGISGTLQIKFVFGSARK